MKIRELEPNKNASISDNFPLDHLLAVSNFNLDALANLIHALNKQWWYDAEGNPLKRNLGELIALAHSELSEGLEGARKGFQDDKLPQYHMLDVELVDALIRILDILAARQASIEEILGAKLIYNNIREDHKLENRIKPGGKAF